MILGAYAVPLQPRNSALRLRRSPSAAAVVALAKRERRWRRPTPEDVDAAVEAEGTPEASGGELDFLASLESEPVSWSTAEAPPQRDGSSLRGVDILQALQRKAAAVSPKGGARKGAKGRRPGANAREGAGEVRDYSNVRGLEIKGDWAERLEELDRLVQELQSSPRIGQN